jgi:hypothetical protein
MLTTAQWEHLTHELSRERTYRESEEEVLVRAPNEKTAFIDVQYYLDFKYGADRITVTLPDKSRANLMIRADGRAYFEVQVND